MTYRQFESMTPEQVERALDKNSSLFAKIIEFTGRMADRACNRLRTALGSVRKSAKKLASCIWKNGFTNSVVNEPTSADPQGVRNTAFPDWSEYPDANYQYRCDRMRDNIQKEIAQEELYMESLEILTGR